MNKKVYKIIWVSGVYLILGLILFMVINYKVKWEHLDLNTYLYFYDCDGNLCSSSIEQDTYYSKILCEDDICPYIKEINNNYLILENNNTSYVYDYIDDKIVLNTYSDYKFSKDKETLICKDSEEFYYVIDYNANILVNAYNKEIDDYKDGYFTYIDDNLLYGIENLDDNIKIKAKYKELILINEINFGYLTNNEYHIATYADETDMPLVYNYIYSFADYLVVINNKKIDILDNNLKSKLVMKIDTEYEYAEEKERESLNFSFDGKYLTFYIYNNNSLNKYIYDYENNKLLS